MVGNELNNMDQGFNYEEALTELVTNDEIPMNVAKAIEKKIVEKQAPLNKKQFDFLVSNVKKAIERLSDKEKNNSPSMKQNKDEPMKETFDQKSNDSSDDFLQKSELKSLENNSSKDKITDDFLALQKKVDYLEKQLSHYEQNKNNERELLNNIAKSSQIESTISNNFISEPLQQISSDPENIIVLMNWLQYLIDKCGHEYLNDVLNYYVDIDWISQDVKLQLLEYAKGIKEKGNNKKELETPIDLPSKDHIKSFLFIQKIKGNELDKHFIQRIDDEVERLQKH